MKYAITDLGSNIVAVQDTEATQEQIDAGLISSQVTQEAADAIEASGDPLFFVDGQILTLDQFTNPVPEEVTNYQIKRALNTVPADRDAVEALVANSDQDTKDGWNHASVFKKDHSLFVGAVSALGWSQEKVDDYLKLAVTFS